HRAQAGTPGGADAVGIIRSERGRGLERVVIAPVVLAQGAGEGPVGGGGDGALEETAVEALAAVLGAGAVGEAEGRGLVVDGGDVHVAAARHHAPARLGAG